MYKSRRQILGLVAIWLQRLAVIFIAVILFWSGAEHLKNPFAFLTSIVRYQIIDGIAATTLATALPIFQTVLAAMLIFGISPLRTRLCAAALLTVFTSVQISAIVRGLEVGCGCFGTANDTPITWGSVLRVGLLASLAWALYYKSSGDLKEQPNACVVDNGLTSATRHSVS